MLYKMQKSKNAYFAVDLFCGGGGLTQGLKQAGFKVSAGVELDPVAAATYRANHPTTKLFAEDIRSISGKDLLASSPVGRIDLIAACPPCQGFSSLTFKYKRNDARNELIFEFVRLVKEVRPSAIMMENVPGLANGRGKAFFDQAVEEFRKLGYCLDYKVCDVADYGVPQHRHRLVLLGALNQEICVADAVCGDNGILRPRQTVRDTIEKLPEPSVFNSRTVTGGPLNTNWNIVRNISPLNMERLKALPSESDRRALPENLRPACHKEKNKGFINVYGRMRWDVPSPTITGGCTTLSKGRFGHPEENRTISVLEAALLQTFPETYIFPTPSIDATCKIIGNALPPKFAEIMASQCIKVLRSKPRNQLGH